MAASAAAIEAGKAVVRFSADDSALRNSLQAMSVELKTWGSRISSFGRSMMVAGAAGASLFIKPIMEASRTEQLIGRFSAVFEDAAESAGKFADSLGKSINRSGLEIRDMMAQFQVMLKGVGFDNKTATRMSEQLTSLTQDWVAFDDTIVNSQEALDLFRSAMAGETEPARRMGADLRVVTMNAEFAAKGIKNASLSLSEMERMQWRFGKVAQALSRSGVEGQALREVNMAASRIRGFWAALRDMNNAIGKELLPRFSAWVGHVTDLLRGYTDLIATHRSIIPLIAETTIKVAGLGAALFLVGKAIGVIGTALKTLKLMAGLQFLLSTPYTAIPMAIVAAVPTILTALGLMTEGADKVKAAYENAFSAIVTGFKDASKAVVVSDFKAAIESVEIALKLMWTQLKIDLPEIRGYFEFIENLVQAFKDLASAINLSTKASRDWWDEQLEKYGGVESDWSSYGYQTTTLLEKEKKILELQRSSLQIRMKMNQRIMELEKKAEEARKANEASPEFQRWFHDPLGTADRRMKFEDTKRWGPLLQLPGELLSEGPLRQLTREVDLLRKLWDSALGKGQALAREYEKTEWTERVRRSRFGGWLGQLETAIWKMTLPKADWQSLWTTKGAFGSAAMAGELQYGPAMDVQKEQLITQKKMERWLFKIGEKAGLLIAGSS